MLGMMVVLVWQTGEWLRTPVDAHGARQWLDVECAFGSTLPEAGSWRSCQLPHNWDVQRPGYRGDAWYRLHLPQLEEGAQPQALWMSASMNAEVWVNGGLLGSGGRMQEPVARHWNDALFFSIPANLLDRPVNALLIRVYGYANNSSGLSTLISGSFDALHGMNQSIELRSNLLTFGALTVTMLVGLLTLAMLPWGRQLMLIYFSLGCLTSALYLLDQVVVNIPVSREIWESAAHLSTIWSQMFFLLFLAEFLSIGNRRLTGILLTYGGLALLALPNIASENLIVAATLWEGVSLVFMLIAVLYLWRRWYVEGLHLGLIAGLALASVMMAFMHDWLPFVLGQGVSPPFLFYMGPVGFILVMASVLIIRLANAYRYEKEMSLELGDLVWRNRNELEEVRRQADALIEHRAALGERDRIVRELHDGVGGLLANTLAVVKPSDAHIRSQLSEALNELRMMIGTLDEDADISSLLGLHRSKLQSVIEATGADLHWEFYGVPASIPDHAGTGMTLVRIVQECVYNALRHGHATEIIVHIDQSHCWVSDNGCGFDVEQVQLGRGLKNLRWRAEQLNAHFEISSNASGTKINLFWI